MWLSPLGLAVHRMGHAAVRLAFISTGLSGGSANQDLPPPTSGRWPTVSLSLVINLTVSERASDEVRKMGPLDLPWEVPFRLQGSWWVCSPPLATHLSLFQIISLNLAE